MEHIKQLLLRLKNSGIDINLHGDDLEVNFDMDELPEHFYKEIKDNKVEIISFLSNLQGDSENIIDIPVISLQQNYEMSFPQKRLWFLGQFEDSNVAYNIPRAYTFKGDLDTVSLEKAIDTLIDRHEILRTVFCEDSLGNIKQYIKTRQELSFKMFYVDLRKHPNKEKEAYTIIDVEAMKEFSLVEGPLLRTGLLHIDNSKWILIYNMHHIISDGWSMGVMLDELLALYGAFSKGKPNPLPPLRIQYKDYAAWQNKLVRGNELNSHKLFWLKQFEGKLPVLEMPTDYQRPFLKTYNGGIVGRLFNIELSREIKKMTKENGSTLFMGMLTLVNTLLFRYSGQEDIIIGTPVAGRDHTDLEGQIGFYINTLGLRTRFNKNDNYIQLLEKVKQVTLNAYEYQLYPFDELIDELHLDRNPSRNPLYDVVVVLQNSNINQEASEVEIDKFNNIEIIDNIRREDVVSKFDLVFNFEEKGNELEVLIQYNSDLYKKETIEQMLSHLENLLKLVVTLPSTPISQLDYLHEQEKKQLLYDFNPATIDFPADKTISTLFEEQVAFNPDKIALIFEDKEISYNSLNEKANRLARHLLKVYKIKPNDFIGIQLERSEWMMISILAVLKAGGGYVPIDPFYPEERIKYMIEDTSIKLLITHSDFLFNLGDFSGTAFAIDLQFDNLEDLSNNIENHSLAIDSAYVMYTSGSTGHPKGVVVSNKNVIRLVKNTNFVDFSEKNILLSTGSVSFDATTFEFFGMLLNSGTLVLCSQHTLLDSQELSRVIENRNVNMMWVTAGWLNQLIDSNIELFKGLTTLISGGDKLSPFHIHKLQKQYPDIEIINGYGPTENTTFSLTYKVKNEMYANIPIGKPINNSLVYILDQQLQMVPVSVPGEIYVAGSGLSKGYLNKPELTAERFIENPFMPGAKMYKTGDIGKWLSDGNISFIGRTDDQLKIRGYRIELGEIENILKQYPGINDAAVIAREDETKDKHLIAYLIGKEDLSVFELKIFLAIKLPVYMVPFHFIRIEEFPLTANGKIDKQLLLQIVGIELKIETQYVAPRNNIEIKLAELWQEVLVVEKVGVYDNFFELGGHSLKITSLLSLIKRDFEVNILLMDLFISITIADQANLIGEAQKYIYIPVPIAEKQDYYDLSPSQKRLWLINQLGIMSTSYNIYGTHYLDLDLNLFTLKIAIKKIVERHEVLRTIIIEKNDEPKQKVLSVQELEFNTIVQEITAYEYELNPSEIEEELFNYNFKLDTWPLFKVIIVKQEDTYKLLFSMHHIISDGWSMELFIRDILTLYRSELNSKIQLLPDLAIQYKDYAVWQNWQLQSPEMYQHENYWLNKFEGELPVLRLPVDYEINSSTSMSEAKSYTIFINQDLKYKIDTFLQTEKKSVFSLLITSFNILLSRLTGERDLIIGTPVANRDREEIKNLIGFFLNTLMIRNIIESKKSAHEFLNEVNKSIIEGLEHQAYPFEKLMEKLNVQRDYTNLALTPVFLNMLNFNSTEKLTLDNFDSTHGLVVGFAKFDLECYFEEFTNGVSVNCTYRSNLFKPQTIEYWMTEFLSVISQIVNKPSVFIHDISLFESPPFIGEFKTPPNKFEKFEYHEIEQTIHSRFEQQVLKYPKHVAIYQNSTMLTYEELNAKANGVSHNMVNLIGSNSYVALLTEHGLSCVLGMMATLKSGNAYVPLDPDYPLDRLKYILEDAGCKLILATATTLELAKKISSHMPLVKIINISNDLVQQQTNIDLIIDPKSPAYILYTSGSTGQPKGVIQNHRNVLHFISLFINNLHINSDLKIGLLSNYCHDVSVSDIYSALLNGAAIYPYNLKYEGLDNLGAWLNKYEVSYIHTVPTVFRNFIESLTGKDIFEKIRLVVLGGEPVFKTDFENFKKHFSNKSFLVNTYGPTESSTTMQNILGHETSQTTSNIPLGYPVHDTQIYLLDDNNKQVNVYQTGEIVYKSNYLSLGYLNNEKLTNSVFVSDPITGDGRVYRSGDYGRLLATGEIEFVGRKDWQVKIRGHRVELGEIENLLQSYFSIDKAAVIVKTNENDEQSLVAYIASKEKLNVFDVKNYLAAKLPEYMVPGDYVQLDVFPMNSNGKTDRKALLGIGGNFLKPMIEFVAPRNETESQVASLFYEVLGKSEVGIHENFFDIGGDSLKLVKLFKKLSRLVPDQFTLVDLFNYTTIEKISKQIEKDKSHILEGVNI